MGIDTRTKVQDILPGHKGVPGVLLFDDPAVVGRSIRPILSASGSLSFEFQHCTATWDCLHASGRHVAIVTLQGRVNDSWQPASARLAHRHANIGFMK